MHILIIQYSTKTYNYHQNTNKSSPNLVSSLKIGLLESFQWSPMASSQLGSRITPEPTFLSELLFLTLPSPIPTSLFSHPWLLSLLGFPLTLQIQDNTKNSKNKVSFRSRFEPTPMYSMPNHSTNSHFMPSNLIQLL